MEKKNLAYLIGIALIAGPLISPILSATSEDEDWQLVIDGEDQELIPELEEYRWVLERPPYEQWDKIALWRLVKRDSEPIGAIFIFPGTWSSGEQLISVDEMSIRYLKAIDATPEKVSEIAEKFRAREICHYLALRGWDVYSMDYRTNFVDPRMEPEDLDFMKDWGWKMYLEDAKLAFDKAKDVSGREKMFVGGESFGGMLAMNYASVYWEEDILGIVLLDGGTGGKSNPIDMIAGMLTSIEIPIISSILASILSFILPIISDIYGALPLGIPLLGTILDLLLFEILPSIPLLGMEMYALDMAMDMGILNPLISLFVGIEDLINQYIELPLGLYIYNIPHFQDVRDYAIDHPLDPPLDPVTGERLKPYTHPITGKPIENYMEWSAALLYKEGIPGMFTNIYGGYNDLESLSYIAETFDRYWPLEVYLEYAADIARPGYTTDSGIWDRDYPNFYADYKEIDVPLIAFISGGLGLLVWGPFSPGIKNEDVTGYTLPEWGHLDMYAGTYNDVMINEPTYQWLMERI